MIWLLWAMLQAGPVLLADYESERACQDARAAVVRQTTWSLTALACVPSRNVPEVVQ